MSFQKGTIIALALFLTGMSKPIETGASDLPRAIVSLEEKLNALAKAYPSAITHVTLETVQLRSGQSVQVDDKANKDHQTKLKSADIEDMLSQVYPLGKCAKVRPDHNFDPGRIRNDALMRALYGKTKADALRQMKTISWFGEPLRVTSAHGTADALQKVQIELASLPENFRKFLTPSAGTFNWRNIAGTKRLSVHSFGAAIDINTKYANYWRWAKASPGNVPYVNRIPIEIVHIFESHGFIWGGRWYHYDTMHFEYRPELIAIGKLAQKRGCR